MTCGPRPVSRPASISRSPWSQTTTAHELPGKSRANFVVYLRRSGGQAQFSAVLAAQSSDHEPVRDVLTWLTDNLTADLSIPALAAQATLLGAQKRGPFAL